MRPTQFAFESADEVEPLEEIAGQPRAVEAVQFGIDIPRDGYNIFALGPAGSRKRTLVLQHRERKVGDGKLPTTGATSTISTSRTSRKP